MCVILRGGNILKCILSIPDGGFHQYKVIHTCSILLVCAKYICTDIIANTLSVQIAKHSLFLHPEWSGLFKAPPLCVQ